MENSTLLGIGFVLYWAWVGYEVWRAPMLEERPDGSFKTIRPTKKLSDLFKKKK